MDNKFPKTLAATQSAFILAIVAGLPVDANGFYLSEAQMTNIEAALQAAETAEATLAEAQAQLTTANEARRAAEASLATANTRIAELEAQDAKPAAEAGATEETVHTPIVDANAFSFQQDLYNKL